MISVTTDSALTLANDLRPIVLRISRELRKETEQFGVTARQVTLLWLVKRSPGLTLRALAAEEAISAPALSGHVDRLERAGLIVRVRSAVDRRRVGPRAHARRRAAAPQGARTQDGLARRSARHARSGSARGDPGRCRAPQRVDRDDGMSTLAVALRARTFRSLRRHYNYRLFFAGQIVSLAGSWMQNVALAWLVLSLSRSPLAVAALLFCRFAPYTLFGLFAGSIVDRFDTRRLVIWTQVCAMARLRRARSRDADGHRHLAGRLRPGRGRRRRPRARRAGAPVPHLRDGRPERAPERCRPQLRPSQRFARDRARDRRRRHRNSGRRRLFPRQHVQLHRRPRGAAPDAEGGAPSRSSQIAASRCSRGRARACRSPGATVKCAPSSSSSRASGSSASTSTRSYRCSPRTRCTSGPAPSGCFRQRSASEPSPARSATASFKRATYRAFTLGTLGFSVLLLALAPVHEARLAGVLLVGIGAAFTLFAANANALVQLAAPDHLRGRLVALYLFAFVGLAPFGSLLSGALVELGGTRLAFVVAGVVGLVATAYAALATRGGQPLERGSCPLTELRRYEGCPPARRRNWMTIFGNRDSGYGSSPVAGAVPSLDDLDRTDRSDARLRRTRPAARHPPRARWRRHRRR